MKAVILVGGEGTRLRPLTYRTVKAMVPVLNRPFLEHQLVHLKEGKVSEVVLALGYKPLQIQKHFGNGEGLDMAMAYSVEDSAMGTAGAVKNSERYLVGGGSIFVLNGDVYTDIDLEEMLRFHRRKRAIITIALTPVDDPTQFGVVETDASDRILKFIEKPPRDKVTSNFINAGIYILEPEVLGYIEPSSYSMFEYHVFPKLLNSGAPMFAYKSSGYWIDMGTPEKYRKLNHDLLMRFSHEGDRSNRLASVKRGSGTNIDLSAKLDEPVLVGDNSIIRAGARVEGPVVIGNACIIGNDSVVRKAILWDRVRIGNGSSVGTSIIGNDVVVEDGVELGDNCVVADKAVISRGVVMPSGTLVMPDFIVMPDNSALR
jgi:mannose-1-phosphate guanylyltransferase